LFEPLLIKLKYAAGKDRTGVLSALIMLLIDTPEEEIIHDYMLTRAALENVRENLTQALALHFGTDHLVPEAIGMLELSGVRAHAMAAFLKTFESTYDGIEGYLTKSLGFSPEDLEQMRHNLTTRHELN
jgi:protein tyrosine/serine phosphatase